MRRNSSVVTLSFFSITFACAGAQPPYRFDGPKPKNASDTAMAKLAERYLDASLKRQPVLASYLGYRKWDHLLPDYSAKGIEKTTKILGYLEADLKRIDREKLSRSWAIDHEMVQDQIKQRRFVLTELKPHEWDVQLYNRTIGAAFYYLTIPPEDEAEWRTRLEAVLARMKALPGFLERAKKNLKQPPRVFTEMVITLHKGHRKTFEERLPPLFAPFPRLLERFEKQQPKVIAALLDYQRFLEEELVERSTGEWRLGERYEKKLRFTLASSLSAKEVFQRAERHLDLARFEMYDIALPLFRQKWPNDQSYKAMLGEERVNHVVGKVIEAAAAEHGTAESMLSDVQQTADRIKAFLTKTNLIELPPESDPLVIEKTPDFLDGYAVAFFSPAPAFEPKLKKAFWISSIPSNDTESYLREYNRHTLEALTIHEAFPGHYVQQYWATQSPDASITKRVLKSGTMVEGWACMIEQLVHEAGFSRNRPVSKLFHLKMRLRIYINAMIDARLHTSKEKEAKLDEWAMKMMMERGFQERAEATKKLRRAKVTSTQLSTYFVGYREMLDLYRAARRKNAKPANEILKRMISFGSIPPRMIKRLMTAEGLL